MSQRIKYNPQQIEAYQTSDGDLFSDYVKAEKHQADIIGECLDDLLPYDDNGNMTRIDRFNILMKTLNDEKLKSKIAALHHALNFNND